MTDPKVIARAAHLRYVSDAKPGIRRERAGEDFVYRDLDGKKINDETELERIKAIGIPPAWTNVWISPHANGHILATGRDDKGRKQYRYHPRWNDHRNMSKFNRLAVFGANLPKIRETTDNDLKKRGLPYEKVLAVVVRLLEMTLIRIGNAEYMRHNESYGLTTMRDEHVAVTGKTIQFEFTGKSGKEHHINITHKRLSKIVKACQDIPGYDLFQYYDDNGDHRVVGSSEVNDYLRGITGEDFTAKDFRTWGGSVLAVEVLCELPECSTDKEGKKMVTEAVKTVAQGLGNTTTICRKYYIHPAVIDAYMNGILHGVLSRQLNPDSPYTLSRGESALMELITQ
jgi:DNA topoisomerase I